MSPQTMALLTTSCDVQHSLRLGSVSSEQEDSSPSSGAACAERKKTLEERMNDVVDAVFGPPKNELLKLLQRPPGGCSHPAGAQPPVAVDEPCDAADAATTKHDFQETNSFRPCTCAHCNGLVGHFVSLIRGFV